jgi:hypothetical protein
VVQRRNENQTLHSPVHHCFIRVAHVNLTRAARLLSSIFYSINGCFRHGITDTGIIPNDKNISRYKTGKENEYCNLVRILFHSDIGNT